MFLGKLFCISAILLVILFVGCIGSEKMENISKVERNKSENRGNLSSIKPPQKNEIVILETNKGNIEIELARENAPITVENFISYVRSGFYDGTIFNRVMKGFVIQGGGYTKDGTQKPTKAPIILESNNGLHNYAGTVAMARTSEANSATSQFFINTDNNLELDYGSKSEGYTVFGRVISGMDVVGAIDSTPTSFWQGHYNWPIESMTIKRAYMKGEKA